MKWLVNRVIPIVFAVVLVAFVAFVLYDSHRTRNTPPKIECASEELTVSIHDGRDALLQGVTATDAEDGDLTGQVLVESISRFLSKGVCRVTYVVQDSHNAVTKATRTVKYSDYVSPRFTLTEPLTFDYGKSFDPSDNLTATDCIDGDLTDAIRMTLMEDSSTISGVGRWNVQFRVVNSMGEAAHLDAVINVRNQSTLEKRYSPNIKLKEYLTYLPLNAKFDPASYVTGISVAAEDAPDNPLDLRMRLRTSSEVDTATPGTYTVTYTCVSSNGYSGSVDLIVVVEDAAA